MPDRQDQSDLFSAQLATGGAGIAFFLAAIGLAPTNYGLTIGFLIGAIVLFFASHHFHKLAMLKLQWPLTFSEQQQRGYWRVFTAASVGAAMLSIVLSAIFGMTFYIFDLRKEIKIYEAKLEIRHLRSEGKDRMRRALALGPNEIYELQVNSAPGCDECEQFAEEIRIFLNTIPGWKAGGGPLIFPQPPRRGLWLVAADLTSRPVELLFKAFEGGGVPLTRETEGAVPNIPVILVARQGVL
jgi:hypothetical protein